MLIMCLSLTAGAGDCCESTCEATSYDCGNIEEDSCVDPLAIYAFCDHDAYGKYYEEIGNGVCDTDLNIEDCDYDGGESHGGTWYCRCAYRAVSSTTKSLTR